MIIVKAVGSSHAVCASKNSNKRNAKRATLGFGLRVLTGLESQLLLLFVLDSREARGLSLVV